MPEALLQTDDQIIAAQFFKTGKWLTEFITPDAPDVKRLAERLDARSVLETIAACHQWVASKVRYKSFISGRLTIEGYSSSTPDLWMEPATTMAVKVGNCANKSFLLTSLLRNFLSPDEVSCVLGNLTQRNTISGHAWVEVNLGDTYVVESTREDMPAMVLAKSLDRYEGVVKFNDKGVSVIEGKTALQPFAAVYVEWLRDYLDWAFINGSK